MNLSPAYCLTCEAEFRIASMEWPPKMMVCPSCSVPMKLVRQTDDKTCVYTTIKHPA